MTKKVFRPFWSYDVKGTEHWLREMALKGYHLKTIHPITRFFVFEHDDNPKDVHYHIEYAKKQSSGIPSALLDKGWERILQARKWYVLRHDKPSEKRIAFPVREGLIRRNRNMMYLFGGIFLYTFLTSLVFVIMSVLMLFFGYALTFQANAFWMTTIAITIVLWALAPYSAIKLYRRNHIYW